MFTYSISISRSGFEPAAKATKELNTRFHRLSICFIYPLSNPDNITFIAPKIMAHSCNASGYMNTRTIYNVLISACIYPRFHGFIIMACCFHCITHLSTNAHPNKSGIIFPAFIGLYRNITKAIYNPLRPCNTPYKRLHRIRGYKIAACAAVLFPCVYHTLYPR